MRVQNFKCQVPECGADFIRPDVRGKRPNKCHECGRPTLAYIGKSWNSDPVPDEAPKPEAKVEVPKPEKPKGKRYADLLAKVKGHVHERFEWILDAVTSGGHAYLHGPAGSGKSTAARQLGQAMELRVYVKSCHPLMTEADMLGYLTIDGQYRTGIVREAFEHGGVLLLDELDAANPEVLMCLNNIAALEPGEHFTFPCGTNVARHDRFIIIGGGNTVGNGADENYTARQPIDASTLDRFDFIEWNYDERLERKIAPNPEWCEYVQKVRKAVKKAGAEHLVSPRVTMRGGRMLNNGTDRARVESMTLWKGVSPDQKRTILAHVA